MYKIQNPGWYKHCELHHPLNDLGNFIHSCAEDPVTRAMSATALVLALGQAAGPSMLRQPPGFLLVNASGETTDPIDEVMKTLTGMERPKPRPEAETFERNLRTMEAALKTQAPSPRQNQPPMMPRHGTGTFAARSLPDPYQDALQQAFGSGRVRWYADAHHERFGWAGCDSSKHLILRVDRDEDRLRLRQDLRQRAEILVHPQGFGTSMHPETKTLSIAGSLPAMDWDLQGTVAIIEHAIPVLLLPHTADTPLVTPEELRWLSIGLASDAGAEKSMPVSAWQRLGGFKEDWIHTRIARLRQRLAHFPPDYEFFVMSTVRELLNWCADLVSATATHREPLDEKRALLMDLYTMVLQGVCLGVEALGWHGYGFETTCERVQTCKVLAAIRDRGSISKRELLRHLQWLTAESRDAILAAFEGEGLVQVTDQEVTALPFVDYWRGVRHRAGRNMPAPLWKAAERQAAATPAAH